MSSSGIRVQTQHQPLTLPPTPDQADQAQWCQLLTFGTMTSSFHLAPGAPFMGLIPHHIPLFSLLSRTRCLSFTHQWTLWSPLLCSLQCIYIFIFGCSGSLLLSLVQWVAVALCFSTQASHFSDFSCCRAWVLGLWASVVATHRLRSCGTQVYLPCGMWGSPHTRSLLKLCPLILNHWTTRKVPSNIFLGLHKTNPCFLSWSLHSSKGNRQFYLIARWIKYYAKEW